MAKSQTTAKQRLNAAERRQAILDAVLPMFAEFGMSAVTTRELAAAAGVSEALLFRHFPSKESLFDAVQDHCFQAPVAMVHHIDHLVPNTKNLCAFIHVLFTACRHVPEDHNLRLTQIMLRSLLSDGEFARVFYEKHLNPRIGFIADCVKIAEENGDLINPLPGPVSLWFPHHLSIMMKIHSFPSRAVVDYECDDKTLIKLGVEFSLRGMGLSQQAINQNYTEELVTELEQYWESEHVA